MVAHLLQKGWLAMGRAVSRAAVPRTCPKWLVWLLCVLAWRGPIPVVHSHEMDNAQTVEVARHLALYHGSTDQPSDNSPDLLSSDQLSHDAGWHLHFVLPDSDSAPGDEPESGSSKTLAWPGMLPEMTSLFLALADSQHGINGAPRGLDLQSHGLTALDSNLSVIDIAGSSSSNLSRSASMFERAPRISMRVKFCVARC